MAIRKTFVWCCSSIDNNKIITTGSGIKKPDAETTTKKKT